VRPGRAADHSPPSSAAVNGRVELYLYPPCGPHRACNGKTLPWTFTVSCYDSTLYISYALHILFVHRNNVMKFPTNQLSLH